ncbi:4-hydroxy-tetrahydrodipicolinate synthase, partial [Dissostichus eleginoides]
SSLRTKSQEESYPAKNLKRARTTEKKQPAINKRKDGEDVWIPKTIVHQRPSIEGLLERWPALFHMEEVNAEFMHKLLQVIRSRGGVVKQKTTGILQVLDETVDITIRRECILKSLMIYLGEPVDHLIKEFQEAEAGELEQATMAIFVIGKEDQFHRPKDVKIYLTSPYVAKVHLLPDKEQHNSILGELLRHGESS